MRQLKDTDLFPWILGLGLLAAGAFGAVLIMAPPAPRSLAMAAAARETLTPAPPAIPTPPKSAPVTAPEPLPEGAAPPLANNPIWQCEVNGQKIFADSPCGAGASIRVLNETNRMNPARISPSAGYSTYSSYEPPPYTEPYSEDIQSIPGTAVYVARPVYWRKIPPRPGRGHHPESRGAPRAHGM